MGSGVGVVEWRAGVSIVAAVSRREKLWPPTARDSGAENMTDRAGPRGGRASSSGGMFCTTARFCHPKAHLRPPLPSQIQGSVTPHAIVVLPKTDGMEMLLCYEDEGVYVNTYGRITKDVVLQWGEMPTSVGRFWLFISHKTLLFSF